MTTNVNSRRAHALLNDIANGRKLGRDDVEHLRSYLPELPIQKTLEELRREVYNVWTGTNGNEWPDDIHGDLETWLDELQDQLTGLKDTPAPGLPDGMRMAKHEKYGRCVVSPGRNHFGQCMIFVLDSDREEGSDWHYEPSTSLTFLDTSPTARAHPEFLETEADYQNAPEGTIVACEDSSPWYKSGPEWLSVDFCGAKDDKGMSRARRRVLRWGYGND